MQRSCSAVRISMFHVEHLMLSFPVLGARAGIRFMFHVEQPPLDCAGDCPRLVMFHVKPRSLVPFNAAPTSPQAILVPVSRETSDENHGFLALPIPYPQNNRSFFEHNDHAPSILSIIFITLSRPIHQSILRFRLGQIRAYQCPSLVHTQIADRQRPTDRDMPYPQHQRISEDQRQPYLFSCETTQLPFSNTHVRTRASQQR